MKSGDCCFADVKRQRMQLARWLIEWRLGRILQAGTEAGTDAGVAGLSREGGAVQLKHKRSEVSPATGQIRLLPPAVRGGPDRPVYVALLRESGGFFLAAPFSGFSTPAVPGEWLTGLKAMPVRVLSLWNARVVSGKALAASWCAGDLTDRQVAVAMEVYGHARSEPPLEPITAKRIGPPVRHPLDPRLAYMAEESDSFEESIRMLEEKAAREKPGLAGFVYDLPVGENLIAAERRSGYGRKRVRGGRKR